MKELKLYGLYSTLGMGGAYHIFWYKRHAQGQGRG